MLQKKAQGYVPSSQQKCTMENTITSQKMSCYDSSLKPSRFDLYLRPSSPTLIQKPRPPHFSRNHFALHIPYLSFFPSHFFHHSLIPLHEPTPSSLWPLFYYSSIISTSHSPSTIPFLHHSRLFHQTLAKLRSVCTDHQSPSLSFTPPSVPPSPNSLQLPSPSTFWLVSSMSFFPWWK